MPSRCRRTSARLSVQMLSLAYAYLMGCAHYVIETRQTDEYSRWFDGLWDRQARFRILARILRMSLGNPGDAQPVGDGISELRIDCGPGYRVYFKQLGTT